MGLFNFFSSKKKVDGAMIATLPIVETSKQEEFASEVNNVQMTAQEQKPNNAHTVSYATGWPIDVIYGYLHKNYEEKGFNDAMVKSDLAFRDMNTNIIRNKILMVFREITLNYDAMQRDLQTRLDTCNAAGLITAVSEIEKNLAVIHAHQAELEQLEDDFRNGKNEASIPLQSYECGFLRGIATIALSGVPQNTTNSQDTSIYGSLNKQLATA